MWDLTGFQRDLLYVVAGCDRPKGVEVKDHLDDYYGSEVNYGRLYPNLDDLVEKGLVEKGSKDDRTNEYALTARGRRELAARREWERTHRAVDG
ncbi:MAG: PadR family transcriptional regulator [Halobacteriaceae archaeon]